MSKLLMLLIWIMILTIFVTLLFKNYVPTIIFTSAVTMVNIGTVNSEYKALYPWAAVQLITTNNFIPKYPPQYSYIAVFATSIIGFIAIMIYFKKVDIH